MNDKQEVSRRQFRKKSSYTSLGLCSTPLVLRTDALLATPDDKAQAGTKQKFQKGLVSDARYIKHKQSDHHPESPERLNAIHQQLKQSALAEKLFTIAPKVDPLPYVKLVYSEKHIAKAAKLMRSVVWPFLEP